MNETAEKQENVSKGATSKELLQKLMPMMRLELIGFTKETEEGLLFTLPGGKQYRIYAEEV